MTAVSDDFDIPPVDLVAVADVVDSFPGRVRALRLERSRLTVEQAARRARLDAGYWRKIERGTVQPSVRNLLRIQYALQIENLEVLFFGTPGLDELRGSSSDPNPKSSV